MNQKLQKVLQRYLFSRVQSIPQEKDIDFISGKQKEDIMMAHLPLENLLKIKQIRKASQPGLEALFTNQILRAKQSYTTANKIIQSSQLNCEASLIVKDEFNASESYFNYRQRNYEDAKANLQIALESCMVLINKYNYDFMQGRPIHLACNLVKAEACSGNQEKAIKIACYLINNLENNCNNSLYEDIDLLKPIQHLSFRNESVLFTQVFEEVAKLLASCDEDKSNELVNLAANFLGESNLTSNKQIHREYTWFENKKVLAEGRTVEFLERASIFLAEGRGSCKLLWHATVLDVLKICQTIDSEISKKLQLQITEDFSHYKYLPSVLKA